MGLKSLARIADGVRGAASSLLLPQLLPTGSHSRLHVTKALSCPCFPLPASAHPIPPAWSTFLTSQVCLEYNLSNFDEERRRGMLLAAVVSKNCGAVAKLQLASRWPQKNNATTRKISHREVKENHGHQYRTTIY